MSKRSKTVTVDARDLVPPTEAELAAMVKDSRGAPDLSEIPEVSRRQFARMARARRERIRALGDSLRKSA